MCHCHESFCSSPNALVWALHGLPSEFQKGGRKLSDEATSGAWKIVQVSAMLWKGSLIAAVANHAGITGVV